MIQAQFRMPFEFIDNSHINRKSRKVIRSHAAKTKGVSKVPIQHKRPTQPYQASRTTNNNELLEQAQAVVNWLLCPPLERQFSDSYAVTPFPVEMDPRSRGLVQKCKFTLACLRRRIVFRSPFSSLDTRTWDPLPSRVGPCY